MACIKGKNGKEDHYICVYNEWIFDSNFEKALVLSVEALGVYCSSFLNEKASFNGCSV
jgi:hypothetical protein